MNTAITASILLSSVVAGTPGNPSSDWLSESLRKVTPDEAVLLSRAQSTLVGNTVSADIWKPYRGIVPSVTNYRGVWNWDAAFHAVAVSNWDPELAREQFKILFDKQQPNGALPDVIREDGRIVTYCTKPPVMAWAVAVAEHRSPDETFLREIYPKLVKLGDFWLTERGGAKDGLFHYGGAYDSGWDNSIRWDNRHPETMWEVDLNCYMFMHYRALAYFAEKLNLPDDKKRWLDDATQLAGRINEKLWDEKLGFYVDRDKLTGAAGPALSPAGFMPLFVHIASPAQAARVALLAADPQKFFPGMPTAAYDTPGYESGAYWRGPAWLNTSYFAIKGLQDNGSAELAGKMRSQVLDWVTKDPSTIWEYYDSKSGQGAGAKGFGWSSAFVIAFILDWDNDNLTWLFPQPETSSGENEATDGKK